MGNENLIQNTELKNEQLKDETEIFNSFINVMVQIVEKYGKSEGECSKRLGKMIGIELAKKIREVNQDIQILFIMGYPDYMAEGYEVDAMHYLMKPVSQEKLVKVMEKAVGNLKSQEKYILLQGNGERLRLPVNKIIYVEVFSHSCVLHMTDETVETRTSIGKLESELGTEFIRVHRSFLVHLSYIKKIVKAKIFLENGEAVPLERRKYAEVNLAFIHFYGGGQDLQ